ncbi:MAG TPA: hypothetical protein VF139_08950 [Candidatus Polarisedimenticolaceae bacterium]
MRPLSPTLVMLLPLAALAAEPDAEACKASLQPWIGRSADALTKEWGEPAGSTGWRGGGKRLVFDFAKREAVEVPATAPLPPGPDRERQDKSTEGVGTGTTYSRTYSKSKGKPAEWKDSTKPEAWLPSAYVFHVNKDGVIKKVDCEYGPPE